MDAAPPTISFEEFSRVELKVATVLKAEPHPQADRLIVLQIDLGSEQRQIIAGLRGYYEPAQLAGRQIVVVTNLAPRSMRGLESRGMLLAASTADRSQVVLLTPERPVPPGTAVG